VNEADRKGPGALLLTITAFGQALGEPGQAQAWASLRVIAPTPSRAHQMLHAGLPKPVSATNHPTTDRENRLPRLPIQKEGAGGTSTRCTCDSGPMTVRYMVLQCRKWNDLRRETLQGRQTYGSY